MNRARWFLGLSLAAMVLASAVSFNVQAGQVPAHGYRVLAPITSGNLTIFPVVSDGQVNTSMFLTLDEGIRSGEVVVSESGMVQPLVRRRGQNTRPRTGGAEVNTLMLVNNSKKPLLLLAGEIVTGGKQDRVIAKDRIVPAESDPIDLGVFCVEPGRWTGHTEKFGALGGIAQPNVRANAMAKKDQQQVWDSVRGSNAGAMETVEVTAAAPTMDTASAQVAGRALGEMRSTTSYAQVMNNKAVQKEVDKIAKPIESRYRSMIKELREQNAVGVVVAVNGEILWADIFASNDLLEKYWPKLIRSYATEAMTQGAKAGKVTQAEAQSFVSSRNGTHETTETEPGLFRHSEISGDDYRVFELTSLLPKTDFAVHIAKMHEDAALSQLGNRRIPVR
jgi:hypothetical protein